MLKGHLPRVMYHQEYLSIRRKTLVAGLGWWRGGREPAALPVGGLDNFLDHGERKRHRLARPRPRLHHDVFPFHQRLNSGLELGTRV